MLSMPIRFKRKDGMIVTFGVSFEAKVTSIFRAGDWEVWHKKSATNWAGVGYRATSPSLLMLGKISLDKDGDSWFTIKKEVEPGRGWKKETAALIAEALEMSGTTGVSRANGNDRLIIEEDRDGG